MRQLSVYLTPQEINARLTALEHRVDELTEEVARLTAALESDGES
jgi:hypothetical protein